MARRRDHRRHERGLASTEMVILTPAFLLMVLLPIHMGLWWHAKQTVDLAATQALDAARVEAGVLGGNPDAAGHRAADAVLASTDNLENVSVQVQVAGDVVTVDVSGRARYRVVPGAWGVQARAQGQVERFIGEQERR